MSRPPVTFLTLPTEIRLEIYRYLLTGASKLTTTIPLPELGDPDFFPVAARGSTEQIAKGPPVRNERFDGELSVQVLRANSQVMNEARSVLYGENCFDIELLRLGYTKAEFNKFFEEIGPVNSSQIRSIRIRFRVVESAVCTTDTVSSCKLARSSRFHEILKKDIEALYSVLEAQCPNLQTIRLLTGCIFEDNAKLAFNSYFKVFKEISGRLKQGPTVTNIIIEAYPNTLSDAMLEEAAGWKVEVLEFREACIPFSFSLRPSCFGYRTHLYDSLPGPRRNRRRCLDGPYDSDYSSHPVRSASTTGRNIQSDQNSEITNEGEELSQIT